ncbi:uncharacterized protein LOC110870654 [Helianthus annuus]|uniref:uncharacterized protein LOC110870654 n=1 Tax=Helianthus annuus TaxID=4232 RepID=UPI000B8EF94D|nr:uncharacterized protein LOC110870654 [Helianthus annuus]
MDPSNPNNKNNPPQTPWTTPVDPMWATPQLSFTSYNQVPNAFNQLPQIPTPNAFTQLSLTPNPNEFTQLPQTPQPTSNNQKSGSFWKEVCNKFHALMQKELYRKVNSTGSKYREMNKKISMFCGYYNNAHSIRPSGASDETGASVSNEVARAKRFKTLESIEHSVGDSDVRCHININDEPEIDDEVMEIPEMKPTNGAHDRLMADYFAENPIYTDEMFRHRFRMSRRLFLRIANDLANYDLFFTLRWDATGKRGFTTLQKCTSAIRQLAYSTSSDMWDEYLKISDRTSRETLYQFCKGLVKLYTQSPYEGQQRMTS